MASLILMVRPAAFGFDPDTAADNAFQKPDATLSASEIHTAALQEFDTVVEILRSENIDMFIVEDTVAPIKPDAIFPNNWVSFHENGLVILYPMKTASRRLERRTDFFDSLSLRGVKCDRIVDLSYFESQGKFLEGTGSLIFDYDNKAVFASLSQRTNLAVLAELGTVLPDYFLHSFESFDKNSVAIYHTNVMMCIAREYAVVCLEAISDLNQRQSIRDALSSNSREIIDISLHQVDCFAGNMFEVLDKNDHSSKLVLSSTAHASLTSDQISSLSKFSKLIVLSIPTIERIGGGSVRCMMCKIV
jgi:hypothetical protein